MILAKIAYFFGGFGNQKNSTDSAESRECVIKYQIGKLDFPSSPEIYLPKERQKHLVKTLTVDENSIAQLVKLPLLHKDPFDRLIMAQALQHDLIIMTEDTSILGYPNIRLLQNN